ncbi:MAG: alpha/beta hydrolase, partial [Acidobacteria bacterium]|nr:alpha/beta hydrolase [Acidobacteriota bacterium]
MKHTATILVCAALLLAVPLLTAAPPVKDGFITTSDGVRLHYLESGSGPTIDFVPGWNLLAEIREHQIRHFAKSYRVIALDPRSQGKSQQTTEGHYPERRAQDIKELVDQLNLAPAVPSGRSLGEAEVLTYVDL